MGKINILSSTLTNKIAAGEVVERPASVVKELLENSIDAGSTNIKVIIKEFGIQEIRIIDNGSGIANDDIEKAFLRHATSKIATDYDLFHINTLGFRGEALASIASVSNIDIKSCAGEEQGKHLIIEGGEITLNEYYAPIKGTDITVKNLFYNTPARLKYLRNPHTEQANIMNIINKLALSYPNIAFEVLIDGKMQLKTYGDKNNHKIISKIYSVQVAQNMLNFEAKNDDYSISGYISKPEETRSNKNYINIFINGRYIKNYVIQNALVEAYGTFLMKNRYPIVILNIEMDSILLDVNVHPTKQEVRLSKEHELVVLIKETIAETLANNTYIVRGINNVIRNKNNNEQLSFEENIDNKYEVKIEQPKENDYNNYEVRIEQHQENNSFPSFESKSSVNNASFKKSKLEKINFEKEKSNFFNFIKKEEDDFSFGDEEIYVDKKSINNVVEEINDTSYYVENEMLSVDNELAIETVDREAEVQTRTLPQLKVLAQLFKTYILAETGDELFLIDQHAAQERYNYERLQKVFAENNNYRHQLLVPLSFDFSTDEAEKIKPRLPELLNLGICLEQFGDNSYVVREYPIWIEENEVIVISDILEKILNNKNITLTELRNDAIAMASCKASIKANQYLTIEEMEKVIEDLYSCQNPFTCPHGRPIISKMTKKDLEKMFKRIV